MISNLTRRACCILLGEAIIAPVLAQEPAPTGTYPRLARGLNFHHLLNWPEVERSGDRIDYVWPPFGAASYRLRDDELARLARLGFDFIRLTVDPSIFLASDQDRRAQLFVLARERLNRILDAGLKVIFDLHPVSVNPSYAPLKLVEGRSTPTFRAYVELVEQAAGALRDLPHDKFAFELMNEPWLARADEIARWPDMQAELHDRARAAAPNLPLILTGAMWSDLSALMKLDVTRYRDSNVIYTFHYYDPHTYTHQGYERDDTRYIGGLAWPVDASNVENVRVQSLQRVAQDPKTNEKVKEDFAAKTNRLLDSYAADSRGPERIRAVFGALAHWIGSKKIAPNRILLGEFGALSVSNGIPALGRLEWIRTVRTAAEEFGFPWAFWAYKGYGNFALADASGTRFDEEVLTALGMSTNGFATPERARTTGVHQLRNPEETR